MMRRAVAIGLDAAERGRQQSYQTDYMFDVAQRAIEETRQLLEDMGRQLGALEGQHE